MDRAQLARQFSVRLNLKLCEFGYRSVRSEAGVQLSELAKVAGVSYQMARKYALGVALPELNVVLRISHWLGVNPGWLIFGEEVGNVVESAGKSIIKQELLAYILGKCFEQFSLSQPDVNVVEYILEVIYDASHLNTDTDTTKKIIDMMLSSALTLNNRQIKKIA